MVILCIVLLFHNEFNAVNNTGLQMLDDSKFYFEITFLAFYHIYFTVFWLSLHTITKYIKH